jgi:hypothetical protein
MNIKVVKETHETNFGHEDLIIQGNVSFPKRKEKDINGGNYNIDELDFNVIDDDKITNPLKNIPNYERPDYYTPYQNYTFDNKKNDVKIFNKQAEINSKKVEPVKNQKDYFELYRYGINKLNKPNDNDNITFSISLFKPNSLLDAQNGESWMKRYFQNHLKQIILINYFFPESNYRTYLDFFMLAKFESFDGNDDRLKVTKYVDKFEHFDFEEYEYETINNLLINFYKEIKKYENYQFENGLARILFYYDTACRSVSNNGKYVLREKTGDFFVYKFKGPFLERLGHITDGYIGQAIRYIPTIQKKYKWNNNTINRPTHLVWRDAHTNSLGYNDAKWINELNKVCKIKKNKIFFLPASLDYRPLWNDEAVCKVNNIQTRRSAIAGIVQFVNFTNDENFIPFDIFKQSIGMIFLLDMNNNLPLKLHRPWSYAEHMKQWKNEYEYGIEEYCFSSFFNLDYFMKNSIFYNHHFIGRITEMFYEDDKVGKAEFLLHKFLVDNNILSKTEKISRYDFIKLIENLRNDYSLKDNRPLSLLLAIYPTKYFFNETIFSIDKNNNAYVSKKEFSFNNRLLKNKLLINELTFENLAKININCLSTAINNALEWCTEPYIQNNSEILQCNPEEFLSGFYYDNQPNENIAFLRSPNDLEHVISVLEKNNLKLKLNSSNYKLYEENSNLKMITSCNHDKNGNINYNLINKIINYNNIGKIISGIPQELYSELIWKALNSAGYDVPPEYFTKIHIDDITKISSNKGWINHTIKLLTTCNHLNYSNLTNIKMDTYKEKYLKYKQKYLNLVNKL